MGNNIIVQLSEQVKAALAEVSREEGVSQTELITTALSDYLFIRKFRRLREKMLSAAKQTVTDEDVFENVS